MRVFLILLPVVLAALLALLVLRGNDPGQRAVPERGGAAGLLEGEALREVRDGGFVVSEHERVVPAVLRGKIFNPNGFPVRRAEVSVLAPKPYRLVFTGPQGHYEIEFTRPGRYLVEGRLTIDLGPKRVVVDVPEEGDPPPLDFHLGPAGRLFGEVVAGGAPVLDGWVDLLAVDLWGDTSHEVDTDIENGFFNFAFEPPSGVPLRLVVLSMEGYMERPLDFTWDGNRKDFGTIRLTRYPTLRLRLRRPDGSRAVEVAAAPAEELQPDVRRLGDRGQDRPAPATLQSRIVIKEKANVVRRFAIWEPGRPWLVVRDVELALDQFRELEVVVRPGPLSDRRRLLDGHGDPVRARLALAGAPPGAPPVETGPEGFFDVVLPHGGVHTIYLTALFDPDQGWIDLPRAAEWPWTAFLLDADRPGRDCRLDIDGRLLVRATAPTMVWIWRGEDLVVDVATRSLPDGEFAALLGPLEPGDYAWGLGSYRRSAFDPRLNRTLPQWRAPDRAAARSFRVAEHGVTVLDLR